MKQLLWVLLTSIHFSNSVFCQHVGVGTSTPTEKLDVNGNINTTGNLMVNGQAGASGQVLSMNGSTMQWMDKTRFKNWAIYHTMGAASFTVPPGVSEVMIEMWGAGGGAHMIGGGGGSGGYWIGVIPTSGINSISLSVGAGGSGGANDNPGLPGGNTSFSCTGFSVATGGGGGADSIHGTIVRHHISGEGGDGIVSGAILPAEFRNYFFVEGNPGIPTMINTVETAAGVYSDYASFGSGGVAPYTGQVAITGAYETRNSATVSIRSLYNTNAVSGFGCGGTSRGISGGGANATRGGNGRIIIYY